MQVVWSARAQSRLSEIHAYIQNRAPLRATPFALRIIERAELIASAPQAGRLLAAFADEEIREVLERPIRIIYRVNRNRVEILTVRHYRQRLIDQPRDL